MAERGLQVLKETSFAFMCIACPFEKQNLRLKTCRNIFPPISRGSSLLYFFSVCVFLFFFFFLSFFLFVQLNGNGFKPLGTALRNIFASLQTVCLYRERGCPATMLVLDLNHHLRECSFAPPRLCVCRPCAFCFFPFHSFLPFCVFVCRSIQYVGVFSGTFFGPLEFLFWPPFQPCGVLTFRGAACGN